MRGPWSRSVVLVAVVTTIAACSGGDSPDLADLERTEPATEPVASPVTSTEPADDADVQLSIDLAQPGAEISPLIRGISGDLSIEQILDVGVTLVSWGGNPASRYNYRHGHAWNAAADFEFRNTSYGWTDDAARAALDANSAARAETRLAVPALGWVARDGDESSCSFPDDAGGCTDGEGANCEDGGPVADPERTSVRSTPEMVAEWVADLLAEGRNLSFIAIDNEPELWGFTHYDIHPTCTRFEEVLERYLDYATAIREVAPDVELMGPVMCCWFDYWNIDPGPAEGPDQDFLTWFLEGVREHDEAAGRRTLDVVDVHFYPQTGVFNADVDEETNARRLRSTRALWDPTYVDESWIGTPIELIPRLQRTIEAAYPGTPLAISEWNFGADTHINGALAIADTLGIFGREGVYAAAYWRTPPPESPGYYAFKLFGNYDSAGGQFAGRTVDISSSDQDRVRAYAAVDGDTVRVVIVNQDAAALSVSLDGAPDAVQGRQFTYSPEDLSRIVETPLALPGPITVPGSSLVLVELT